MASQTDASPIAQTAHTPDLLAQRFAATRRLSLDLVATLSDADTSAQSMPDASPAKWHLAHTTWFFETFILRDHVSGYRAFDDRYAYLFNSYYEAEGPRHARPQRGLLTRPSLSDICIWRAHVDTAVQTALPDLPPAAHTLIELGIQHEQQHQELLLTDLKHLFAQNPLGPAAWEKTAIAREAPQFSALKWIDGNAGVTQVGHGSDGFAFDCEGPRHDALLAPHALASRPVSNGEWQQFIADGGYHTPSLWLSDGWAWVQGDNVDAPAYWDGDRQFTLAGWQAIDPAAPVTHISFYEADAFASWAGARLPTEFEWEAAAASLDPATGQQLDAAGPVHPAASAADMDLQQMFGSVWEWTGSAYRPYPGFRTAPGAVGEYNGKFMNGQFVLRGGSCATPRGHLRASYRNFFYPHQRWQFTGVRLAKDL
ncbi:MULTISPECIES: ergothioneine biosynthesis protein EgtB [unclassified Sphingopyxis]|jgi:ergothioneine biosynthesis protein EgtB|uniref:ergothioneine biosynthesis protein EgtB n=1 Tax=unclassified Sphingopyxis TaxID=2614943 RepID=UPI002858B220|nr:MULTISPECIES: ergothioneine biosynthesis protein EgtB [unclassified Sphingopyxis]MDR6833549.1 ergothioneine biosynthesis protein EgtB [Sphingopyxis sp. BE122]MDR7225818.1 ergothioneine biosynthesis protein EgtB [Sphingopyxis sp. BE259]